MVSKLSIVFLSISAFVCFMLPIASLIYLYKKEKISIWAAVLGAGAFILSQLILRAPLLKILGMQMWYVELSTNRWFSALFLGLTAGLFEETARFAGLKYLLRGNLQRKNAISFGLGHGGIEAISMTGASLINLIIYSAMINAGTFDSFISGKASAGTLQLVRSTLLNTNPYFFIVPGLERIFAITAHVALTLVVFYGVKNNKNIFLLYAILLHALLDSPSVLIKNTFVTEGYVFIFALCSLFFIIKSKNMPGFNDNDGPSAQEGLS